MHVSQKKQTLNIWYQIDSCFVSQGRIPGENSCQERQAIFLQIYFSICVPKKLPKSNAV